MHRGMTRRGMIAGTSALVASPALAARARGDRLIAGTYAREGGGGLYPIARDAASGRWSVAAPVRDIRDASFGVLTGSSSYLLTERAEGAVTAYGPTWRARRPAVSSGGADPCHAALDRASACLAVANYSSGSVGFYALDPRSGALPPPVVHAHRGSGPDRERQASPHAHWVGFSPDRRRLHSVDLGADAIFAYPFDPATRTLEAPTVAWRAPPGAGPRHLAWHPSGRVAYVVCELDNSLLTLRATGDGRFSTIASVSTLPAGFDGRSQAGHIAIDRRGRRLYVSNRGHDSIATFALDVPERPAPLGHAASGGRWPRFFLLHEDAGQMLVGNERSGDVAVLRLDAQGVPGPAGQRLRVPGVAFIGVV